MLLIPGNGRGFYTVVAAGGESGTSGQKWFVRPEVGRQAGSGTSGRKWDVRPDVGRQTGSGTSGRRWKVMSEMERQAESRKSQRPSHCHRVKDVILNKLKLLNYKLPPC